MSSCHCSTRVAGSNAQFVRASTELGCDGTLRANQPTLAVSTSNTTADTESIIHERQRALGLVAREPAGEAFNACTIPAKISRPLPIASTWNSLPGMPSATAAS